MPLKLITPAATEPVTIEEAKQWGRIDASADDMLVSALITAAREWVEQITNRILISSTWDLWLERWPARDCIRVPGGNLTSVTSVTYYDTENAPHVFANTEYFLDAYGEPGEVELGYQRVWPTDILRPGNAIAVRFVAGWANADAVPQSIKTAMYLMISHLYEHRDAVIVGDRAQAIALPMGVDALLANWIVRGADL